MSTFIKACAGKDIIKPAKNGSLTIDISQATQREVNLLCSKVFYLEACIVMRKSALKYIVCPALREMRPCATGRLQGSVMYQVYYVSSRFRCFTHPVTDHQ